MPRPRQRIAAAATLRHDDRTLFALLADAVVQARLVEGAEVTSREIVRGGRTTRCGGALGGAPFELAIELAAPTDEVFASVRIRRTRALLAWRLERVTEGRSRVHVHVRITRSGILDRAWLALGGRARLDERLSTALVRLDRAAMKARARQAMREVQLRGDEHEQRLAHARASGR